MMNTILELFRFDKTSGDHYKEPGQAVVLANARSVDIQVVLRGPGRVQCPFGSL